MTLARKGTRSIAVSGIRYRWKVAPNDEPGMAIVAEAASAPGQRLVAWVAHGTIITPGLVREVIGWALRHDWQPQRRGPTRIFHLEPAILATLSPSVPQDQPQQAPGRRDDSTRTPADAKDATEAA